MRELMSVELNKALKNPWFYIALAIGCALAIWSAATSIETQFHAGLSLSRDEWLGTGATGIYSSWIIVGTGDLFISGIFFLILPLLVLLPYAWSLQTEIQNGVLMHEYVCHTRKEVLTSRYIAAFVSSGLVVAIPLIVNLAVLVCFVPATTPEVMSNIYMGMREEELWSYFYYTHPFIYVILNTIYDFVVAGAWGGFVLAISFFIENRVMLLVGSYVAVLAVDFFNKYMFGILDLQAFNFSLLSLLHAGNSSIFRSALPAMMVPCLLIALAVVFLRWFSRRDLV